MDRAGADFFSVVNQIKERLGTNPIPLQIPIGQEDLFKGVVDLISNKALIWDEASNGTKFYEVPMPDDLKDIADEYRQKLIEGVAEDNEELMAKFFDDPNSITEEEMLAQLGGTSGIFHRRTGRGYFWCRCSCGFCFCGALRGAQGEF